MSGDTQLSAVPQSGACGACAVRMAEGVTLEGPRLRCLRFFWFSHVERRRLSPWDSPIDYWGN
jgi:hypothetical protein